MRGRKGKEGGGYSFGHLKECFFSWCCVNPADVSIAGQCEENIEAWGVFSFSALNPFPLAMGQKHNKLLLSGAACPKRNDGALESERALAGRAQTNVPLTVAFIEGFEPWEDVSQPRNMEQFFFLSPHLLYRFYTEYICISGGWDLISGSWTVVMKWVGYRDNDDLPPGYKCTVSVPI